MDGHLPADVDVGAIGRVISVSGSRLVLLLQHGEDPRDGLDRPQMGALLKVRTAGSVVYGMISGLSVPLPEQEPDKPELKIAEIELLGEVGFGPDGRPGRFRRGVSSFPSLDDRVFAATRHDLELVYACHGAVSVRVGSVHQDRALPVHVVTDDLLGKHFAVLGTTGSGKSCAVALILRALVSRHPHAHIVVLDPHNEYAQAFGELAEVLDTRTLELPYWLFTFEELVEVVLGGGGSESPEAMILSELVPQARRRYLGDADPARRITVDTPLPYLVSDLIELIEEAVGRVERPHDLRPYVRLKGRLQALDADPRFGFVFGRLPRNDTMAQILSRLFRLPSHGRPVTIIDLSGVPSEVINVIVSVLGRMTFDFAVWSEGRVPTLLVCEEAHRYAPRNPRAGFEPTKRALARIAKEGRKHGVSLCVVSQRPSELATTVMAECNTTFALRLSNQNDQEFVRSAVSESGYGLLDALPSLRNAEAVVVGEGVPVPMRLCFDELPPDCRPRGRTASFSTVWSDGARDSGLIDRAVERWRNG